MEQQYSSFGRIVPAERRAIGVDEAGARLRSGETPVQTMLPVGNTRSYGDSCHNDVGTLVDTREANRILSFDPDTGVFEAEPGIMLSDIIAHAGPHGFYPAVVPGTQFVTLGGAIANDVHGKNHHRRGTFGCHVLSIRLLRSDGKTYHCTRKQNAELFGATIGGLGLTGLILSATIRLMRVSSLDIDQSVIPFDNLDGFFDRVREADARNEYAVAWLDQLASGRAAGRGVLLTGNHAEDGPGENEQAGQKLSVPFQPPINLLTPAFLRMFNAAYYYGKSRQTDVQRIAHQPFFFPLDGLGHWNRLYGPRGLYQHQSVVPEETARDALPELLSAARKSGQASFLTVLKRFGDIVSPGLLSFPKAGFTLTLDFPNRGARTRDLLDTLDRITIDAGGRINPYKDARMSAEAFQASFPGWERLEACRDPAFMSDFWRRTVMCSRKFHAPPREAAE